MDANNTLNVIGTMYAACKFVKLDECTVEIHCNNLVFGLTARILSDESFVRLTNVVLMTLFTSNGLQYDEYDPVGDITMRVDSAVMTFARTGGHG
jgi:hypothetical protein